MAADTGGDPVAVAAAGVDISDSSVRTPIFVSLMSVWSWARPGHVVARAPADEEVVSLGMRRSSASALDATIGRTTRLPSAPPAATA